jgi:uncharacterized protein (DUF2249 family)
MIAKASRLGLKLSPEVRSYISSKASADREGRKLVLDWGKVRQHIIDHYPTMETEEFVRKYAQGYPVADVRRHAYRLGVKKTKEIRAVIYAKARKSEEQKIPARTRPDFLDPFISGVPAPGGGDDV